MATKHPHQDADPVASPPPPPSRRPRGFASASASSRAPARRSGEREKERTKLRERHRRSITSRMLAGLRQHGNFPLPARADMNDVLAALARAAGWTVHPDGTTFRSSSLSQPLLPPPAQFGAFQAASVETPAFTSHLNSYVIGTPLDSQVSGLLTDDSLSLSPSSLDSVVVAEQSIKNENYGNSSSANSLSCMDSHQVSTMVYFDFMRSFHMEFRSLSEEGLISAIEIGLGASGELRYPSCPEKMGWRYPGIGEFQVLSLATLAFDGAVIMVKIPSMYWWYRTASHAAELTAGYYNPTNRDGYSPVFKMLKKHSVILKVVCYGPEYKVQENNEAFADPEGLTWQVMNAAWDQGLSISVESALPCLDNEMYPLILDTAKPRNDPDRHHVSFFAYRQQNPFLLQGNVCFSELETFVKCMHDFRIRFVAIANFQPILPIASPVPAIPTFCLGLVHQMSLKLLVLVIGRD
ncbi:hypothetical protein ACQ4PT_018442 [Festuca glaucescens]